MKSTNWTKATTNPYIALAGLMSAMQSNKHAWIEKRNNGDQDFPIMIGNPLLDIPFNWTMSYGVPQEPQFDEKFFNDTEKDLTLNWTAVFGEADAIADYQKNGVVSEGLTKRMGICNPIRKSDFLILRPDMEGCNLWTTYWKPKDKIPYNIVDPSIKSVYVVCTDDTSVDGVEALENLKFFVNSLQSL